MSTPLRSQKQGGQVDSGGLDEAALGGKADNGAGADAAARRMAGGIVPLKPEVVAAIHEAASKINHAELKGKHVEGMLLGTYIQAGSVKVPQSVDPKGAAAEAFVCMNTGGGVAPPGEKVDGNQAEHFYVKIGNDTYGPLPFNNPLAKK